MSPRCSDLRGQPKSSESPFFHSLKGKSHPCRGASPGLPGSGAWLLLRCSRREVTPCTRESSPRARGLENTPSLAPEQGFGVQLRQGNPQLGPGCAGSHLHSHAWGCRSCPGPHGGTSPTGRCPCPEPVHAVRGEQASPQPPRGGPARSSVQDPSLSPPTPWWGHMLSHPVGGVPCLRADTAMHAQIIQFT